MPVAARRARSARSPSPPRRLRNPPSLPSFSRRQAGEGRPVGPARCGRGCRWTTWSPCCPRLVASRPAGAFQRGIEGESRRGPGSRGPLGQGPPSTVAGYPFGATSEAREPPAAGGSHATLKPIRIRPQIRRDNPLNLSILLSGGKETNQDSLSSGERRGKSPAPNPRPTGGPGKCGVRKTACPVSLGGLSPSDRGSARGRCEAGNGPRRAGVRSSRSRVVWECSPKRVVNSI